MQRTPLTNIEIHVVSNRDRVAHQLFDLWFDQYVSFMFFFAVLFEQKTSVPTEEYIRRFERRPAPYHLNDLRDVDWSSEEALGLREAFISRDS